MDGIILALGSEGKGSFTILDKKGMRIESGFSDLSLEENLSMMRKKIDSAMRGKRPRIIACDMHPGYSTTILAEELAGKQKAKLIRIQHHKSHVASVAAEHGLSDYVGIAMDGMGYGEDGNIWGGEVFLVRDNNEFQRLGRLEEQPLLGGDSATIYPKKMLFGILAKSLREKELLKLGLFPENEAKLYLKQLKDGYNVLRTTSSGRVLDAVSAYLGFSLKKTEENDPAIILEKKATIPYPLKPVYREKDGVMVLLTTPLFLYLLKNRKKDKGRLAATAQMYLARGMLGIARRIAEKGKEEKNEESSIALNRAVGGGRRVGTSEENGEGAKRPSTSLPIVFSGGVAYNRMISGHMKANGVFLNRKVPCGDAGVSFGQAYLANLEK